MKKELTIIRRYAKIPFRSGKFPLQAAIAQSVVRILGKDEVTSSILVSSFFCALLERTVNYMQIVNSLRAFNFGSVVFRLRLRQGAAGL